MNDQPALQEAVRVAREANVGLVVLHGLDPRHPLGSPRVNRFLMEAALETMSELESRGATVREVPSSARSPLADQIVHYAKEADATAIVTDDPVAYLPSANIQRASHLLHQAIPLVAIETNLVVPTRSYGRAAVGAYAIRSHLQREANERLVEPMPPTPSQVPAATGAPTPPGRALSACHIGMYEDGTANPDAIDVGIPSGERAATAALDDFVETKLEHYGERKLAARGGWHSDLSAHLHFGSISPRVVAREVMRSRASGEKKAAFLEQLIVRRELSYNAARYLPSLRTLDALPAWARSTLSKHDRDRREHEYSHIEWERANTHDELWNATQLELRHRGTIHSYMRMYWGKKVIEWSATHEGARLTMETLNGAWALDGRSAPMWANHLWCFGLHDRPFQERPVFGQVRWMSAEGTRRKFDVPEYVAWTNAGCPTD